MNLNLISDSNPTDQLRAFGLCHALNWIFGTHLEIQLQRKVDTKIKVYLTSKVPFNPLIANLADPIERKLTNDLNNES